MPSVQAALAWLLCALVSITGPAQTTPCGDARVDAGGAGCCGSSPCCCVDEAAASCGCDAPPSEVPAPARDQQLALEHLRVHVESVAFVPDVAHRTRATASRLPPWVLPHRSRQQVLSVWRS